MRPIDPVLLVEQKKTSYMPVKTVAIGGVDLSDRFVGYDYREDIRLPKPSVLVFDNSDGFFANVYKTTTPASYTYLGETVDLRRGARVRGKDYLEKLPRLWVEGYRFTYEKGKSLFILDCIDWRGKLDRYRPAADVTWTNTSAQIVAGYLLAQVDVMLTPGMAAVNVNFTFSTKQSAHTALNNLMDSLREHLYAGLDGVVKWADILGVFSFDSNPDYTFGWNPLPRQSGAGSDHPVRPGTWFGFSLWQHNRFEIVGAGGITNFEEDPVQPGIAGLRRKTVVDGTLQTVDDLHDRAEIESLTQAWSSEKGEIVCLPCHGLELMSRVALNMPNARTDDNKLVTGYRETHMPGKLEQRITLGDLPEKGSGDTTVDLIDGIAAPGTSGGRARTFIDAADGDYKIIFGDGTIKTIVTD